MLIWNVDEEVCQGVVARQEFLDTLPQSQLTEGVVRKYHIQKFVHHYHNSRNDEIAANGVSYLSCFHSGFL